jgi:TetR/AcrR family transcriptional regulator
MVDSDALLKAARQAFAKQGFTSTSVREIARASGVDPALLTHHFGSKETLWLAVVEQMAKQAAPLIEETLRLRESDLSERERVDHALAILIDQVFDSPDIGMFFSTAATEQDERLNALIDRLVRPYHDALVPLLADAVDSGVLEQTDPELLFWMLTNAISKTVSYSHLLARFSSLPRRRKDFKAVVLDTATKMLRWAPSRRSLAKETR